MNLLTDRLYININMMYDINIALNSKFKYIPAAIFTPAHQNRKQTVSLKNNCNG